MTVGKYTLECQRFRGYTVLGLAFGGYNVAWDRAELSVAALWWVVRVYRAHRPWAHPRVRDDL